MVDWKHIFYSGVASIANSMYTSGQLGASNGPGFGWRDVDVIALGVEWNFNDALTLRAGYAHNTQPITANNVTFNILAPGVITDQISGGFSWNYTHNTTIDFAVVYAPRASVNGPEYIPGFGSTGRTIELSMSQLQLTGGLTYHFDTPPVVIAKY